jgi:hypothetical protein
MKVSCITGSNVMSWRPALEMLAKAFEPGMADETFDMLLEDLLGLRSLLWLAHIDTEVYGAATTKVVVYPNGRRVCVITACAGREWPRWRHTIKEIEQYAKSMGCAAVRLSGRRGWKILKSEGYREPWVLLEKEL